MAELFHHTDEDGYAEIQRLVKHRYQTGAYGSAHFRMTSRYWGAVRLLTPSQPRPSMPWESPPLAHLLSIPIVVDDDLAGDDWRLVDIHTKEILFHGAATVPQPPNPRRPLRRRLFGALFRLFGSKDISEEEVRRA